MTEAYTDFVAGKLGRDLPTGLASVPTLDVGMFAHQRDLASWALRRGRCAVFANTGLGKSRIEMAYAQHVPGHVLVLTPLAVGPQMVAEAAAIGLCARQARDESDMTDDCRVYVTNYERMHRFDPGRFAAVVCDESSCIKHHDAKLFRSLCDAFERTPFRLCGTATPAPNDFTELGTHAEFLGMCSRAEMLSEYFVHDGGDTQSWRLKGHARGAFWRWVASWGALLRHPRDLGYDETGYDLPELSVEQHVIPADLAMVKASGQMFASEARTLSDRRTARRTTVDARVAACVETIAREPDESWVVWCELNAESGALAAAIPGAVEVRGSDDIDAKEARLAAFTSGHARVMVTKPSIAGWGLNWQHCARVAFVGVSDSWEQYYQAVRRCWRFGQKRPVQVHLFASELEGAVLANLRRKEEDARRMADALAAETAAVVRDAVRGAPRATNPYEPRKAMVVPRWIQSEELPR